MRFCLFEIFKNANLTYFSGAIELTLALCDLSAKLLSICMSLIETKFLVTESCNEVLIVIRGAVTNLLSFKRNLILR